MKLKILPSAIEDLSKGRWFYELQGGPELGDYFFDSLFADIDSLLLYAGFHRQIQGYHRLLASRFPYSIYYKIDGDVVCVWRVLDNRQNPGKTKKQLNQ